MQLLLNLDWVSITAMLVSGAALGASVFSAMASARSADVALKAEKRAAASERVSAVRELVRTAAKVSVEARMATEAFENASRTAIAIAACYGTAERKRPFLVSNGEFQQQIGQIAERVKHCITLEAAMSATDEWITKMQLELDKTLTELSGEKAWAFVRYEQLTYVNRQIAEDVTAAERARGVFVRQGVDGKII